MLILFNTMTYEHKLYTRHSTDVANRSVHQHCQQTITYLHLSN